ncbi:hypothetical protein NDU88_006642 [Pleurodeles waltl]|uniref:Uncharacterized protein n=1 Tax=Pleurodeles waltl TaxID=8319 RepID=A0AAV7PR95_PLEWA|nr:hypothetical protein NDU88_006642 [Pleurodeles waltl]
MGCGCIAEPQSSSYHPRRGSVTCVVKEQGPQENSGGGSACPKEDRQEEGMQTVAFQSSLHHGRGPPISTLPGRVRQPAPVGSRQEGGHGLVRPVDAAGLVAKQCDRTTKLLGLDCLLQLDWDLSGLLERRSLMELCGLGAGEHPASVTIAEVLVPIKKLLEGLRLVVQPVLAQRVAAAADPLQKSCSFAESGMPGALGGSKMKGVQPVVPGP